MPCERLMGQAEPQHGPKGMPHVEVNGELVPLTPISGRETKNHQGRTIFGDEERGFVALFPEGYKLPEGPKIGEVIFVPEA